MYVLIHFLVRFVHFSPMYIILLYVPFSFFRLSKRNIIFPFSLCIFFSQFGARVPNLGLVISMIFTFKQENYIRLK